MTPDEREQLIRSHTMTANERFLLGLLDEARDKTADAWDDGWAYGSRGRFMPHGDRDLNPYRTKAS